MLLLRLPLLCRSQQGNLREHVGLHPDISAGLVQARVFAKFVRNVKRMLLPELVRGHSGLILGFYCESDRHRSVALAYLVWAVLKVLHPGVLPPEALQVENAWRRACRGQRRDCNGPAREPDWAAHVAATQRT